MKPRVSPVVVTSEDVVIPTYLPAPPDKNPMFLEKRVYQGSSGRVYPLPFTDRIAEKPIDRSWKVFWIENEFLRAMVLPELGGRVHALQDKTNGYDLLYRQPVIKPALVGLAGPWISGGIEFNWPQHHRPATFLPVDVQVEDHPDGSKTVWCSDHDPMTRLKGMHGVCLHPDWSCLELKVRVYNRTAFTQTFLWWANVATKVHEAYQSFFPPDVYYVADHARRSTAEYPLCQSRYYGIDYPGRARRGVPPTERPSQFLPPHCGGSSTVSYAPNDLSFYANIPVPTSYMCMGSNEDFFGGYDHFAKAGLVHVANHHIAPGKKQWTWGNHEFGYAWDRNLTDPDGSGHFASYIELMAGVYTDNQPDFSFLHPGETKAWTQYWYPIQQIGPAQHANLEAAVSLVRHGRKLQVGIAVTRPRPRAEVIVQTEGKQLARFRCDLSPAKPLLKALPESASGDRANLQVRVLSAEGATLISWSASERKRGKPAPPATEPPPPSEIQSVDELYLTGLHLEQYRHATRSPMLYWEEALRRDPGDARCNNAVGLWHLRRGEFAAAESYFRKAIQRLTLRNANPSDGEAYYNLGVCLRFLERGDEAYAAFYKATWNQAWAGASYLALAELDCSRKWWNTALEHLDRTIQLDAHNLRARDLKSLVLERLGQPALAGALRRETLALDPLDWWARHLAGEPMTCDLQTRLDLAHDYARAGFLPEALELLESADAKQRDLPDQSLGAWPLIHYTIAWLEEKRGRSKAARRWLRTASALPIDYCFPARLEEILVFESALRLNPQDARAAYYLANLLYDRRRHQEAIRLWERSAKYDRGCAVVWRNLGIGYFNVLRQRGKSRRAYDKAFRVNPNDARLLYERDQLSKRLGTPPERRLRALSKHLALVAERDDLSVELCALLNQTGRFATAAARLAGRSFQSWEGGEGGPLGQHVRAQLGLGQTALRKGDASSALTHFQAALNAPPNLGEAKHLLANQSDIHYWLGCAHSQAGAKRTAQRHWQAAATFRGDFEEMRVRAFSELTYYSALAWERLGKPKKAKALLKELYQYAKTLERSPATIDYFATSLPTMLLFEDDLQHRQKTTSLFLQAQALLGLGHRTRAIKCLRLVLQRDPGHARAADLLADATRVTYLATF